MVMEGTSQNRGTLFVMVTPADGVEEPESSVASANKVKVPVGALNHV